MTDELPQVEVDSDVHGSEINRRAAALVRGSMQVRWTSLRSEKLLAASKARMAARRQARIGTTLALAAAAALLLTLNLSNVLGTNLFSGGVAAGTQVHATEPSAVATAGQKVIRFGDGSLAELASTAAEIDVERVSPDAIDVNLHRGKSNFRVTPNKQRVFTVRAGEVMVTVLGTEFDVEKRGERTWVHVTRGKVSVDWPGGGRLLLAGDEGLFPPNDLDAPKQLDELPVAEPEPAPAVVMPPTVARLQPAPAEESAVETVVDSRPVEEQYRDRAAQRDFDEAYLLMKQAPKVVGSDASELLLAADVARLSGHPSEAVPYLQRVLREHSSDSRAPSAAFTLGRMYLGQLGSPGEAARAFAQVRNLAPGGPLAEDAMAREVEAWARVGDKGRARQLAEQYLKRYPNGRRTAVVKAQAGLP